MKTVILTRRKGELPWRAPVLTSYSNEAELQSMLAQSPELLPVDAMKRPIAMSTEFGVAVGSIDLVGLSPAGWLTVVETKLHANADMRRTVVGQLFAYASALWGQTYEDFDAQWRARTGLTAAQHVARECGQHELVFDEEAFRFALADNLAGGRFTLVIAVDEITAELRRIIEYLSGHTKPDVGVVALELGYLAEGDWEIVVPQVFGAELLPPPPSRGPRWSLDDYFEALGSDSPIEPIVRHLIAWGKERGVRIVVAGQLTPSLAWHFDAFGKFYPLFGADVHGLAWLSNGTLKSREVTEDPAIRRTLVDRLNTIPGVALDPVKATDGNPSLPLLPLGQPTALATFKEAWEEMIAAVRRGEADDQGRVD